MNNCSGEKKSPGQSAKRHASQRDGSQGEKVNTEQTRDVIANWNEDDQPRARLQRLGANQLSTAELLAICLGSGGPGEYAVRLARRLLDQFKGIGGLLGSPFAELLKAKGVGEAKASMIKAVHELMARDVEGDLMSGESFNDPGAVSRYLRQRMGHESSEAFACLFLNTKNQMIAFEVLFRGSIDRTHVHPREVLKRGLELNAAGVILTHNHPSGVAEPSQSDILLTVQLKELLSQVDIRVLDHIVVSSRSSVSLQSRGLI